ncbi:MAG TPA: penicillin-binding transpeptidase domain-containing protein [Actinomycetota bacterium]|nr:penicillin-binding transpeptidase domain-containing protein [Actinomycetota bacterium]
MRKWLVGALVIAVLVGAGIVIYLHTLPLNSPTQVADAYIRRWDAQDWGGMRALVRRPPAGFRQDHTQVMSDLQVSSLKVSGQPAVVAGKVAQASVTVTLDLKGLGSWTYQSVVHLSEQQRRWEVDWSPATIFPKLTAGERFTRHLTWATRAPIQGRDGSVLQGSTPVESIGVEPAAIADIGAVEAALQQFAGVVSATVTNAIHAPGVQPTWFLPLTTLRPDAFSAVKSKLAVPGIITEASSARLPISDGFALPVLGTTGPITAQLLGHFGPPYVTGSVVGLSGLELAYERQLAGTPSADIELVDSSGKAVGGSLDHFQGTAPKPVQITLDAATQSAAEQAFAGVTQTAALVAVDAATGEIRAVVNRPAGGFDRALDGNYPPGSTFKIVTTEALLAKGDPLSMPITCPTQTVIDGKTFKNIENEQFGNIDLQTAFVQSCNTAYVQMASTLSATQMEQAASLLGFNAPEPLGLASSGASYPAPKDIVDQDASAIGQGRVLTSPVHMASVAAAVASGAWHQPTLVSGESATATVHQLDPGVAANLRTLMGLVVTQGTGKAAAVAGDPVFGKTGTAEFGTANPPKTHAWFVGFRGGLAFAIIVEGGGVGGVVAAPIAARFLSALPGS